MRSEYVCCQTKPDSQAYQSLHTSNLVSDLLWSRNLTKPTVLYSSVKGSSSSHLDLSLVHIWDLTIGTEYKSIFWASIQLINILTAAIQFSFNNEHIPKRHLEMTYCQELQLSRHEQNKKGFKRCLTLHWPDYSNDSSITQLTVVN